MAVLGLSGFFGTESEDYDPVAFFASYHDAAACLVQDGRALAAAEEERFNREKHTNRFPLSAIRACLDVAGLPAHKISHVAYFFEESYTDLELTRVAIDDPAMPLPPVRDLLHERLAEATGVDLRDRPTIFTSHHRAHAASAFFDSGLHSALVVVSDGNAEREGTSVFVGDSKGLRLLRTYARADSLGNFYAAITKMIGYRVFDEYKMMGLAQYGDPTTYRCMFKRLYSLEPDGSYVLANDQVIPLLLEAVGRPRRSSEPISEANRDLAAAAQDVVEQIGLHVITHWLKATGSRNLCLAGGVAQNTSMNGRLLRLDTLDHVFVPTAPHDAGAALGAAMIVDQELAASQHRRHTRYSTSAYLGAGLGTEEKIRARIEDWRDFVTYRRPQDLEEEMAVALADGAVVGWTQGRAEFGPRALGNRSILADPRSAAQRDRVNLMIKQREGYRPFAPVVTADEAARFFEIPATMADHSHMSFVIPVRSEHRGGLGAVTHVDGTARVQVLQLEQNPRLWRLLKRFQMRTGIPVLLNTSFNNDVEPIVQSVDDIIAGFLTTRLSLLVVGPFLVHRREIADAALASVTIRPAQFCRLEHHTDRQGEGRALVRTSQPIRRTGVSEQAAELLTGHLRPRDLGLADDELAALVQEIAVLWDRRLVTVVPAVPEPG